MPIERDAWNRKVRVAQVRSRMLPEQKRAAYWKNRHTAFAQAIWSNIADLRGWWVKVGQFLSTRADLLPDEYVAELTKVQDMMPVTPFAQLRPIIEQELGQSLDSIFDFVDEKALASASIGQVHKGRLKTGEDVVIKIQHPSVDKLLSQDMALLGQLSWAFGLLEKGLNFTSVLDEWQKQAALELDFTHEAKNQIRVYHAMKRAGINVKIPLVYPEFTTKKVLVMEFINGFKCTDQQKLKEHNIDVDWLCSEISRSFAYQIHVDGMFNGDPHPGNIMIEIDPVTGKPIPVLIDWGLVKEFDERGRLAFARTIVSVANVDVMGLMESFQDMGFKFKPQKGKQDDKSPIPIDPEIYMDAISVMFTNKPEEEEIKPAMTEEEKAQMWKSARETNVSTIQEQNPLDDWPKDIIFFLRVASLLHGLTQQLKAKVPFFQIMLERAEEAVILAGQVDRPLESMVFRHPEQTTWPRSALEWKLHKLLAVLSTEGRVLGCQISLWKGNKRCVDLALGKMGPVDGRAIHTDSLFTAFSLSNILLSTMLLWLVHTQKLKLDDCVCEWWNGFIGPQGDKRSITVEHLLTNQSGLHGWFPSTLTLSQFTMYRFMIQLIEAAIPKCQPGQCGHYPFYSIAWVLNELILCVTKQSSTNKFLRQICLREWKLRGLAKQLYLQVPQPSSSQNALTQPTLARTHDAQSQMGLAQVPATRDASLSRPSVDVPLDVHTPQGPDVARPITHNDLLTVGKPSPSMTSASKSVSSPQGGDPSVLPPVPSTRDSGHISDFYGHPPPNLAQSQPGLAQNSLLTHTRHSPEPTRRGIARSDFMGETRTRGGTNEFVCEIDEASVSEQIMETSVVDYTLTRALHRLDSGAAASGLRNSSDRRASLQLALRSGGAFRHPDSPFKEHPSTLRSTQEWVSPNNNNTLPVPKKDEPTSRLVKSKRDLGVARMADAAALTLAHPAVGEGDDENDDEEIRRREDKLKWLSDLAARKRARPKRNVSPKSSQAAPIGRLSKFPGRESVMTEYLEKEAQTSSKVAAFKALQAQEAVGVSTLELMRLRPHLLDPIVFDSNRITPLDIPCANARISARAMATLMHQLGRGAIVKPTLVKEIMKPRALDPTLEARIATGGFIPLYGLGFQLLPIEHRTTREYCSSGTSFIKLAKNLNDPSLLPPENLQIPHLEWNKKPQSTPYVYCTQNLQVQTTPATSRDIATRNHTSTQIFTTNLRTTASGSTTTPAGGTRTPPASSDFVLTSPLRPKSEGLNTTGDSNKRQVKSAQRSPLVNNQFTGAQLSTYLGESAESSQKFGFGVSDLGGNLCFTFPSIQTTICVLVNDLVSGSFVSQKILDVVLEANAAKIAPSENFNPYEKMHTPTDRHTRVQI